ncbi:MAG: YiiX/YebB-like N1pC/P60 family cysteine hydrolase [Neisseria sp.]|nr:YiiX/YebB-like N1pC/P60 family cysteine hydrolase [Neisseria sp.]
MRRFLTLITALLLLLGAAVYAMRFAPSPPPRPADLSALPPLAVGDWVLRMGTVADSRMIRHLGGGDYSHIGMVVTVTPQVMVIHATTDDGAAHNQVQLSPLSEFFSPDLAQQHAVLRPQFLNAAQKHAIAERLKTRRGEAFVLAAKNRPHLYCTTLLADEIRRSAPDFSPRWQTVSAPLFDGEYLFPRAFAEYPHTQIVYLAASAQHRKTGAD